MATLANLIKNIDPPRQMTWAEYNALPTQIKNDRTQYYITDRDDAIQTATTTPALDKDGNNSNVQTELDSLKTDLNEILYGPTTIHSASYLKAPHRNGIETNEFGNIVLKKTNTNSGASWHIDSNDTKFKAFMVYPQKGTIRNQNQIICYGIDHTDFISENIQGGWLSASSTRLSCSFPCLNNATTAVLRKLTLKAFNSQGMPYMKYGTNAGSSIQLNGAVLWQNYAQKYANSINSLVLVNYQQYIRIQINFTNALVTTSGGTTATKNNVPVTMECSVEIEFQ